jgi:hypothetical protein
MAGNSLINSFPRQKVKASKKTDKWQKECVDKICEIVIQGSDYIRASHQKKLENSRLRSGILNPSDLKRYLDPFSINDSTLPDNIEHIGIGNNKLERLIGDEFQTDDGIRVFTSSKDKDGISRKEKELHQLTIQKVASLIQSKVKDPKQVEKELRDFQNYTQYEYQDLRERLATKILKRELIRQEYEYKKSKMFDDLLTFGEEIAWVGIQGRRPVMEKLNPIKCSRLGGFHSEKLEDADIIMDWDYLPVGKVIDNYAQYLKDSEIDALEEGRGAQANVGGSRVPVTMYPNINTDTMFNGASSELFLLTPGASVHFDGSYNADGEVVVVRGAWASYERVGVLTYLDDWGDEQEKFVADGYIVDEVVGESITWEWKKQWWEFVRIGKEIYPYIRPIEFDSEDPASLSNTLPNYVGIMNNRAYGRGFSLLDTIKPLDMSYSIIYDKMMNEVATHHGSILAYSTALIPHGWDMKKWLNYVTKKKHMPLDPTQEILKGPSQGKSAGAFNQLTATELNFSNANTISTFSSILQLLENLMSRVSGVSEQREGDISPSEKVRNVQAASENSALVTMGWTALHSLFKKRLLQRYFEVCKYAYKKYKNLSDYGFDELSEEMISQYNNALETHFDIFIDLPTKSEKKLEANLDRFIDFTLQSGSTTLPQAIMLYKSDSILEQARKMEVMQEALQAQEQEMRQQANQVAQERLTKEDSYKQRELDLKELELNLKYAPGQEVEVKEVETSNNNNAENNQHTSAMASLDRGTTLAVQASKERTDRYKADTSLAIARENKTAAELGKKATKK